MSRRLQPFLWAPVFALCSACNDADQQEKHISSSNVVFLNYRVTAEEGKDSVTCFFEFREGTAAGKTILWPGEGPKLDGKSVKADSAMFTGIFYEVRRPVAGFNGTHVVSFTDANGVERKQTFEFFSFRLKREIPPEQPKGPFTIHIDLPGKESTVHLMMIDTSFASNDVNETVHVKEGKLLVTAAMLANLSPGPIFMELFKQDDVAVTETGLRGKIIVTYGLRREFGLKAN